MTTNPKHERQAGGVNRRRRATVQWAVACLSLCCGVSMRTVVAQSETPLRLGILSSGTRDLREPLDEALVQGLREQGYVEGRNLIIERRYGSSRIREHAGELAGLGLDAILTTCTPSTRIMKETTASTPIVMAAVSDPVRQGIVASLSRPGSNVTGTSSQAEDLLAKRLELVAKLVPRSTTVAVLANGNNPVHALGWDTLSRTAQEMNLVLLKIELKAGGDLAAGLDTAVRARAGALFVLPDDPMMMNLRPQIVELAAKHNLPDFHWASEFVAAGGLLSYGENLRASYRTAAAYVGRVKKGASPATLPVQQPTRFELVINTRRARALGIDIPQSLLVQADEVVR